MKQFSLFLNILLLVAVGVLFYFHFAADKKPASKTSSVYSPSSPEKDSCAKNHLIGFVEIDSLYDNVEYIKQKQKSLEADQNSISASLQNEALKLEGEKNDFLKKGNAITQAEYDVFQKSYIDKQRALEEKRQIEGQNLAATRNHTMEEIQKNIKKFLAEYNSDRRYSFIFATGSSLEYILYKDSAHNITPDVIKGLNDYFSKKAK